jgi:GGDEF domain-containing protein
LHIGLAIYPKDEKNLNKLLELAYFALKNSKKESESNYKFYNEEKNY